MRSLQHGIEGVVAESIPSPYGARKLYCYQVSLSYLGK